jgi:hypothetical membrane protein
MNSSASPERTPAALTGVLLLCGVLSPAIYIGADLLAAKMYPGFSYTDQAVSELFAIDAPTSGLVVLLFSVSSALLLAFGLGVWRCAGRRKWLRLTAVMFACSAINALVLWNVFPMHMRGAERSMTDTMHLVLAANPFVLLSLVSGAAAFRGGFRAYTLVTILALVALAGYGFSFAPAIEVNGATPWLGLTERMAQFAVGLWQMMLATVLWRERRRTAIAR